MLVRTLLFAIFGFNFLYGVSVANEAILTCEVTEAWASDEGRIESQSAPELWTLQYQNDVIVDVVPPYRCTSGESLEVTTTSIYFSCRRERLFPATQTTKIERYTGAFENRMAFDAGGYIVEFGDCRVTPSKF